MLAEVPVTAGHPAGRANGAGPPTTAAPPTADCPLSHGSQSSEYRSWYLGLLLSGEFAERMARIITVHRILANPGIKLKTLQPNFSEEIKPSALEVHFKDRSGSSGQTMSGGQGEDP